MPINYVFKDSKTAAAIAGALKFVEKFSKHQALVKFSDSSVSIVWGGATKTYFIHVEITILDMFKNRQQIRHYGIDHGTVIQVSPCILSKILRGGSTDRNIALCVMKPNKVRISVECTDTSKRTIVHTLPCEIKTLEDYKSMLIEEVELSTCCYDTRSYVDNVHRLKHIVESFARLNTPKTYIWSKQSDQGNDLTLQTRTQGSNIHVGLSDLENGFSNMDDDERFGLRREEAGVNVDTKRLSLFLGNVQAQKRSKVSFDVEHNKCLKLTLENEILQGEKFYQSLLLLHSLNG